MILKGSGLAQAKELPAYKIAGEVNRALADHNRLIITAPPGAGKSTVLPLTMLEGIEGKILMLEPRRVASRQIASRMASLLGEPVGQTVGYRIRFESKVSRNTRVEVLTEGILSRMLIDDAALEGVGAVIFDEFHERSLICDEALALTRQAQEILRDDLRIVLMSATMDAEALSQNLGAPIIEAEGKMFPVEIRRTLREADESNVSEIVAQTVREAHAKEAGDILAFLPGEGEIRRCEDLLGNSLSDTHIFPLYGMLSNEEQKAAIAPGMPEERRVVLATPIAETSLTIEGVRIVVDGGLCKRMTTDLRSGLPRLQTQRISMDMAIQRSGRAGRVAPGICYRLYSAATEARMAPVRTPEILDADLAPLLLDLAAWGGGNVQSLPWVTPPPAVRVAEAQKLLSSLSAIDEQGRITAHGRAMNALPCHPRISSMILRAGTDAGKALAADIAALLEEKDPMTEIEEAGIDLRLNELRRNRAGARHGRWSRIIRISEEYARMAKAPTGNGAVDPFEAGALIAAAWPERVGRAYPEGGPGCFLLSGGEKVAVPSQDPLAANEWIAVAHLGSRSGGVGRIFLASPVAKEDLMALARRRENVFWDSREGVVIARREVRLGNLLLESSPVPEIPKELKDKIIVDAARKDGLSMFDFSDEVANLQRRISFVEARRPELALPDVSSGAVLARADEWVPMFSSKATSDRELKKIDLCEIIRSFLSYEQLQDLDRLAPTHVTIPTGSRIRLEYRQGAEAPVLRVRLQECFGLTDTPRVDGGRLPILMELLSPGFKPVQLTSDLANFWKETYFEVRKELRNRYPRHSWPDDPLSAAPVRGVRKQKS